MYCHAFHQIYLLIEHYGLNYSDGCNVSLYREHLNDHNLKVISYCDTGIIYTKINVWQRIDCYILFFNQFKCMLIIQSEE